MKNKFKLPTDLWLVASQLLSDQVESITIKTKDSVITFKRIEGRLSASIHQDGDFSKVVHHGSNSLKELVHAFESLGICVYQLIQKLLIQRFRKTEKVICIDLTPESNS